MDLDLLHPWSLGLLLACIASAVAFFAGWRGATLRRGHRRLLLALAALVAFGTAFPVGFFGFILVIFGIGPYCEDAGYCASRSWVPLGLALFSVAAILLYLTVRSVKEYRRIR